MRTILWLVVIATVLPMESPAQERPFEPGGRFPGAVISVTGGFGLTSIDGVPYYLVNIQPELTFGKVGMMLDINFRFRQVDGGIKLRTEDWDQPYDFLRMIRTIRYGARGESIYGRLGVLDYTRLGHGFIMYYYRNNAGYESRKVGIEVDLDFDRFGVESVFSDLGGNAILGLRGYVRPLLFTDLEAVPVIGGIEVGATMAADLHPDANKTWGDAQGSIALALDNGAMVITGLDMGLPLLSLPSLRSRLYLEVASIAGYGHGTAAGIDAEFSGLGFLAIGGRVERRWVSRQFLPAYFDGLYERQRYTPDTARFMSKAELLRRTSGADGYYGDLVISLLGTFQIYGGYQGTDGMQNAGRLHLELHTDDVLPAILLSAGYDRSNIGQVFKLDQNSVAYAEVGYRPIPWLVVSMTYVWTFVEVQGPDGQVVGYSDQRRVEPRVGVVIRF